MLSLLGAEGNTSFWSQYGLLIVLLVLLVAFMIYSTIRRKKYDGQVQNLLDNLKVGDNVKTYSGFYGKIVSIRETTDGKVVLIEMGEGDRKGYIEADINAIMGIDKKTDVVYDANGNIVLPDEPEKEQPVEESAEDKEHVSTADKLRAKKSKKNKENSEENDGEVEAIEASSDEPIEDKKDE